MLLLCEFGGQSPNFSKTRFPYLYNEGTHHEIVVTLMFKDVRAQLLYGVVAGACNPEANLCYIMGHC